MSLRMERRGAERRTAAKRQTRFSHKCRIGRHKHCAALACECRCHRLEVQ